MAAGRMLSKDASIDPDLNALSLEAEMLYLLTLPHLDRDGLVTGDPVLLWAQAAPKRLELLDKAPRLIQEWIDHGLVERYSWKDGPILFFPGFRKHNRQLDYGREAESRFPPPPGWTRSAAGLVPDDPDRALEMARDFDPRSAYHAALLQAANAAKPKVATGSRKGRDHIATSSRRPRDPVVPQDQDQDQHQDHSGNDDGARARARRFGNDDDGESPPAETGDARAETRPPAAPASLMARPQEADPVPMDELALELIAALPEPWHGAPAFLQELDDTQRLCLLTWLWLWEIFAANDPYDRYDAACRYGQRDPWKEVKNPVGKIITQTRRAQPAPLHPDDLANLKSVLNERMAELAPNAAPLDRTAGAQPH